MIDEELEIEIKCLDCGETFKHFHELLVFHIPETLIRELKIKQHPHLKCPSCRGNKFIFIVKKDLYGEY